MTAPAYRIRFSPRRLPRALAVVVTVLVALHVGLNALHAARIEVFWDLNLVFNVDEEPTVPTWYSSMALLLAAFLTLLVARRARREGDRDAGYWHALAFGLAFLSLDEVAAFHELLNTFLTTEWTVVAAGALLVLLAAFLPFLRRLPGPFRGRLLLGLGTFLAGAVVVEHLTGVRRFAFDIETFRYALMAGLEEALEMYGVVLVIRALLLHLEAGGGAEGATAAVAAGDGA